jgi:hypothetical protein
MFCIDVSDVLVGCWNSSFAGGKYWTSTMLSNGNSTWYEEVDNSRKSMFLGRSKSEKEAGNEEMNVGLAGGRKLIISQ